MTLTKRELDIRREAAVAIMGAVQDHNDGREVRFSNLCRTIRLQYGMGDAFVKRVLQTDYRLTVKQDTLSAMEEE